ncbi:hypothetical protein B0H13DRAFT_2284329 [Mycena leptocephala]|nr:hypothetical protein B0H13DRAFT_2284329 [Mycena leptocephala]
MTGTRMNREVSSALNGKENGDGVGTRVVSKRESSERQRHLPRCGIGASGCVETAATRDRETRAGYAEHGAKAARQRSGEPGVEGETRSAEGGYRIVWERRDLWRWPIREGTRGKEERNVVRRQKAQTGGGAMRRHPAHCVHGPDGEGGESGLERETRGMSERISTGARRMGRGGKQRTNTRDLYVEPYASQDRHGLVDRHGGRENSSRTCRAAHEGPGDAFGRLPQYNKPNLAWAGYHRQGNAKTHCAVGVLEGQTMVPRNKGQVFTALSRTKIAFVRNLHHGKLMCIE